MPFSCILVDLSCPTHIERCNRPRQKCLHNWSHHACAPAGLHPHVAYPGGSLAAVQRPCPAIQFSHPREQLRLACAGLRPTHGTLRSGSHTHRSKSTTMLSHPYQEVARLPQAQRTSPSMCSCRLWMAPSATQQQYQPKAENPKRSSRSQHHCRGAGHESLSRLGRDKNYH